MKFLGSGGMTSAMALKGQQGTDKRLSKVVELNSIYRVFLPIIEVGNGKWTVAAAAVVGRQLDYDAIGHSFVLTDYDVDEFDRVKDVSGLDVFARLSSVLYDAAYNSELARIDRDAEATAINLKTEVDAADVKDKKQKMEWEFYGGRVNNQRIYPSRQPLVGPVVVNCVSSMSIIKLRPDDESPENAYPTRASFDLSSTKATQFEKALKKLTEADKQRGYIELVYDYTGDTKQAAGQNAKFEYVPQSDWLETKYPKWFETYGKEVGDRMLKTQEAIASKNRNLAFSPAVEDVIKIFKNYVNNQKVLLPYIDTEDSNTRNSAEFMLSFEVFKSFDKLNRELTAIISEKNGGVVEEELPDNGAIDTIAKADDKISAIEEVGAEQYENISAMMDDDMPSQM